MFVCSMCKLTNSQPKEYLRHVQLVHSESKIFHCGQALCFRNYTCVESLRSHVYSKHNNENKKDHPLKIKTKKLKLNILYRIMMVFL